MPLNLTRSLLTVILPGMVAIGPWLLLAMIWFPKLADAYEEFSVPFHIAAFGLAVVAGSAFEELGSYLEKRWDNSMALQPEPKPEHDWVSRGWCAYLSKSYGGEPVVYRYLSRKVTALYFELGMMCAMPIALLGSAFLTAAVIPGANCVALFIGLVAGLAFCWLWRSARHTHQLLCETRHFIFGTPAEGTRDQCVAVP